MLMLIEIFRWRRGIFYDLSLVQQVSVNYKMQCISHLDQISDTQQDMKIEFILRGKPSKGLIYFSHHVRMRWEECL